MSDLVILDGVRTPFAKSGGALADIHAEELGRIVAREILDRTGIDPATLAEVFFGCVGQSARAANIARVTSLLAGIPDSVPAMTVHRNCASGMEAITQAHLRVLCGRGDLFLVGGTESMSNYPLEVSRGMTRMFGRLATARSTWRRLSALASFRPSHLKPRVALLEGLTDPVCGINMGQTAENIARDFGITRAQQDEFALRSHLVAAETAALRAQEMVAVIGRQGVVDHDTSVRDGQSIEALARLRPVFERGTGTVTAGNACPVTDGAVALVVASEERAQALDIEPLGRLVDWEYVGLDPSRMGMGPAYAIGRLLEKRALSIDDIDLFEINEAFAAQVLGVLAACSSPEWCRDHLGREEPIGEIPLDRLNVNGGAIAIGHPVGASGARLVLTLLEEMKRRGVRRGIASLCVGGGQGAALLLER